MHGPLRFPVRFGPELQRELWSEPLHVRRARISTSGVPSPPLATTVARGCTTIVAPSVGFRPRNLHEKFPTLRCDLPGTAASIAYPWSTATSAVRPQQPACHAATDGPVERPAEETRFEGTPGRLDVVTPDCLARALPSAHKPGLFRDNYAVETSHRHRRPCGSALARRRVPRSTLSRGYARPGERSVARSCCTRCLEMPPTMWRSRAISYVVTWLFPT